MRRPVPKVKYTSRNVCHLTEESDDGEAEFTLKPLKENLNDFELEER